MRTMFLLIALTSHQGLATDAVVWDAKRDCQNVVGRYWQCAPEEYRASLNAISQVNHDFIRSSLYYGVINYQFSCSQEIKSPRPGSLATAAQITFYHGQEALTQFDVAYNPEPREQSLITAIPFGDISFAVKVQMDRFSKFSEDCQFKVISHYQLSHIPTLEWYGDRLINSLETQRDILNRVTVAATLPTSWQVIEDLPRELAQRISDHQRSCQLTYRRLTRLLAKPVQERSDIEQLKIGTYGGSRWQSRQLTAGERLTPEAVCSDENPLEFSGQIGTDLQLVTYFQTMQEKLLSITANATCQESDEAEDCQDLLADAIKIIKDSMTIKRQELSEFASFIDREIERLQAVATSEAGHLKLIKANLALSIHSEPN